jgi:hypothetical protein
VLTRVEVRIADRNHPGVSPTGSSPESPNQGTRKPHHDQLAEVLLGTRPGDWARIALADLPTPKSGGNKRLQGNVIEAMRNRKVGKIQTRVQIQTRVLGADLWVNVLREVKGK